MEKRNLFDFMCDHPFITMMIATSICEMLTAIFRPKKQERVVIPHEEVENMKSAGSTEEEM